MFCGGCLTPLPPGAYWCSEACHRRDDGPDVRDDDETFEQEDVHGRYC